MACPGSGPRRFRIKVFCGEPYHVAGRRLTPVVCVASFGKARGTIGHDQISGSGGGFAWYTPLAFVEETQHGDRRIPIWDATSLIQGGMLLGALVLTLSLGVIRWMAHRARA